MKSIYPARIEQSTIFVAGKPDTHVFYTFYLKGEGVPCELSYEELISLRDLINEIEQSRKGGRS